MIRAAQIENNVAVNLIVIDEINMRAFMENGMELLDSEPLGLAIGDYRDGGAWYREMDGTPVPLPLPEPEPAPDTGLDDMRAALALLGVEQEEADE